jgi:hypothetical protein
MDSQALYNMILTAPLHFFNFQIYAFKNEVNRTVTGLRILDSVSLEIIELSQLNGRVEVSFAVDPAIYRSG